MKTLLFDFGCILVGLHKQRCIDALEKIGCGRIAYYVDECRQEDLFHDLEVGGSIEAFCDEARRQSAYTDEMGVFHPCKASNEDICWAWNELITGIPVRKLRLIKYLHDVKGYRTAILSNTNQIHWQKAVRDYFTADGLTVDDYFDQIFLSCDLGMVKPDDCIFEEVKGRLGGEILFIDDSAKNCEAAEALGIKTLHDPKGDLWPSLLGGKAAIIGNFDGVHLGHRHVIGMLCREAEKRGLSTLAITFDRHPKEVFFDSFTGTYLATPSEKEALLRAAGIDEVRIMPFTRDFADITARDFMQRMLRDEMGVKLLLLGYDNHFGKRNEAEGFEQYVQYGEEIGMEVMRQSTPLPRTVEGKGAVSSSLIRRMLLEGRMEEAAECLGRYYELSGKVVKGHQEGRRIGFPTANIDVSGNRLLPPNGVYASRVKIDGKAMKAITNIGFRPTYNGEELTVETHIPGYEGDLYGQVLSVELLRKLRDERRFTSADDLREQIEQDIRNS